MKHPRSSSVLVWKRKDPTFSLLDVVLISYEKYLLNKIYKIELVKYSCKYNIFMIKLIITTITNKWTPYICTWWQKQHIFDQLNSKIVTEKFENWLLAKYVLSFYKVGRRCNASYYFCWSTILLQPKYFCLINTTLYSLYRVLQVSKLNLNHTFLRWK